MSFWDAKVFKCDCVGCSSYEVVLHGTMREAVKDLRSRGWVVTVRMETYCPLCSKIRSRGRKKEAPPIDLKIGYNCICEEKADEKFGSRDQTSEKEKDHAE